MWKKRMIPDSIVDFSQDLQLRGLAKVSRNVTEWHVKRFLVWATQEGIDASLGQRIDLLLYLNYLRSKGLKTASLSNNYLRRAGMSREFIQELRGDVRRDAIDIYDHIDKKELKESYLAHIPQLGI
jgi:site-specific recombinase XerD